MEDEKNEKDKIRIWNVCGMHVSTWWNDWLWIK